MATIAWLGTGLLGSGFVKAALRRGDTVRVWNRTAERALALASSGAVVAATPEEAVRGADRVHACVSDDAAVDGLLDRLLATSDFKGPFVDHTTTTPTGTTARAARLHARGIGFLACPVFMGPVNAAEASGRMLCAGPASLVEALAPALKQMTGELVQFGEDVSVPATYKLVGNAFIIGVAGVLADALAVGAGGGVDPKALLPFIQNFPLSGILNLRGGRMVQGDYAPSFELAMARKDLRLMHATAKAPLGALTGLAARMDALIDAGHGTKDLGVLSVDLIPQTKP